MNTIKKAPDSWAIGHEGDLGGGPAAPAGRQRVMPALAVAIAAAGVLIHVGAILGGPAWFIFFGAPPAIVRSAEVGTWLAPVSSLLIAAAMGLCGLYAASALGWVRRLPLLRMGLAAMAAVCLLRAVVLVPLAWRHPALVNTFEVTAALVWGLAGLGLAQAFRIVRKT
ncbi:hypothetical protein ACS5PK_18560 [Roseateles sp. DB2]|uniref:hypothetical protein n=1 Tax=Roseateles sp. DB2 TaxID=3453717 RepID=UPI003EE90D71